MLPEGFRLITGFVDAEEQRALWAALLAEVPFRQPAVRLFGRLRASPRLACWMGEAPYRYSGITHPALPWTPSVAALRQRLEQALAHRFNGVLINLYRDGSDAMGWHADDEPELGPEPLIASLSLGAERLFAIRRRPRGPILRIPLPAGSLLLMHGASQRDFLHALPAQRGLASPRINLTFRQILETEPPSRPKPAPDGG